MFKRSPNQTTPTLPSSREHSATEFCDVCYLMASNVEFLSDQLATFLAVALLHILPSATNLCWFKGLSGSNEIYLVYIIHSNPTYLYPTATQEPPVGTSLSLNPNMHRTGPYTSYTRGDHTQRLEQSKYPRLLPAPATDTTIAAAPYSHEVLEQITSSLRAGISSNVRPTPAYEVNLSFIALCNTNLMHLADDTARQEVEMRLCATSGIQLIQLARAVQLGIHDCRFLLLSTMPKVKR